MADREDVQDSAVNDFLQILEEHRKNCERQGKYGEAELAKARLEELRMHEENRRREAMRSRHIAERLGVEEAHMLEFQQFNAVWDKKMTDYDHYAHELIEGMRERHLREFQDYQAKTQIDVPQRPKFSRELLNLRRIQECLAKQREYAEADKVKRKGDQLEHNEIMKWEITRAQKIATLEGQFLYKQASELKALEKRMQSGREEQRKTRASELDRILQRYQNVKSELESQQHIERIRSEKNIGKEIIPPLPLSMDRKTPRGVAASMKKSSSPANSPVSSHSASNGSGSPTSLQRAKTADATKHNPRQTVASSGSSMNGNGYPTEKPSTARGTRRENRQVVQNLASTMDQIKLDA